MPLGLLKAFSGFCYASPPLRRVRVTGCTWTAIDLIGFALSRTVPRVYSSMTSFSFAVAMLLTRPSYFFVRSWVRAFV